MTSATEPYDHAAHASAFGGVAADYAAYRPGYPDGAVSAAIPVGATSVLDLGAGTGKLTASLRAPGRTVYAVEPDEAMLDRLRADLPDVLAASGSAERIPLADGTIDAVVVGQAWHWFDVPAARAEIARVLRPAGTLALLWNTDDRDDPLTAALGDILDSVRPSGGVTSRERITVPFDAGDGLAAPELVPVDWSWHVSPPHLHALEDTKSYLILADPDVRGRVHREIDEVLAQFGNPDPVVLAQRCQVWIARKA